MRTVVVTGIGAVTPLGRDVTSTWEAMLAGRSGAVRLSEEWVEGLACQVAAPVTADPLDVLDRVEARKMDRSTQLAMMAAQEAWGSSGLSGAELDRERVGVAVGTGIGGLHSLLGNWDAYRDKGPRRVSPFTIPMLMANAPAANVGVMVGARADVHCPVSACASGNEAISHALDMIRLGRADVYVAGGTEAVIHPLPLAAFGNMQALTRRNDEPQRASRPWDQDRDGFLLGEGAALLVLESLEHAQARGATIYATLAGAGVANDSHDMVQPDPTGAGQALAVRRALADADLAPADVVHVNAHATSTPQGDVTEATSIRLALGETTAVCSGTKSMTGHLLGAAGALESIATIQALRTRTAPPTINLDHPEPGLGIDIATAPRELPAGDIAALNNSFGFGGTNVALIFSTAHATS